MGVNVRRLSALIAVSVSLAACGDGTGVVKEPVVAAPEAEIVEFESRDGVELHGFAFGEGDTAVVLAHGRNEPKEEWIDLAVELARNGVVSFPFDFRGYAGQEGTKDTKLAADVTAAVQAIRDRGATNVFVVGASMGGTAALAVAAEEDLAGVVSVSGPARFRSIDAEAAMDQIDEPALFVVADGDEPYAEDARTLAEAVGGRLETFSGDKHGTQLLDEHGPALIDLIVSFVINPQAQAPAGETTPFAGSEPPAPQPTSPPADTSRDSTPGVAPAAP